MDGPSLAFCHNFDANSLFGDTKRQPDLVLSNVLTHGRPRTHCTSWSVLDMDGEIPYGRGAPVGCFPLSVRLAMYSEDFAFRYWLKPVEEGKTVLLPTEWPATHEGGAELRIFTMRVLEATATRWSNHSHLRIWQPWRPVYDKVWALFILFV